ncbi:hypothetical protein [Bradyrhizobium elkanii]|uniref:Uncharacterized protein n=1 Tax=Bradyrhizobium elkanii TaxID=29448 RepID=A0A8I1Y8K7_BRAEL|nr:hypothetical protein [Bradyrhizobium elkanii]MBP1294255.1 hypothetical protein [Bradyrhizobium elkanii]
MVTTVYKVVVKDMPIDTLAISVAQAARPQPGPAVPLILTA